LRTFSIFFFFQAEDGIRDATVTGVQTCALPILTLLLRRQPVQQEERQRADLIQPRIEAFHYLVRRCCALKRNQGMRLAAHSGGRSEERRVGKEWRVRGGTARWERKRSDEDLRAR